MTLAHHSRDRLVQELLELSTPNVSDALDRLGLMGAPRGILPLWSDVGRMVGRAMTVRLVPPGEAVESPVLGTLEAILAARAGDVLVVDHGGALDVNSFGGVAAFTAITRRLVGCVIDGVTRDVDEMRALGFPVFARGVIQQSIRDRCACAGHGGEVGLGGVRVRAGDLVMGDANGIVLIPQQRAEEVLGLARSFAATEERVKDAIAAGMDPRRAHETVRYDQMTSG